MPRRPWQSLNAFSASPIRVSLDQSGAANAARWIARSGWREASARVRRVSRVANANASACGPLPAAHARNCHDDRGDGDDHHAERNPHDPARRCGRQLLLLFTLPSSVNTQQELAARPLVFLEGGGPDVLQVGLGLIGQVGPAVRRRVGVVAAAQVHAVVGRRLV